MFEGLRNSLGKLKNTIQKTELKEESLNPILWDFKIALLANDVGLDVAEEICEDVKQQLLGTQVSRTEDKRAMVDRTLRGSLYKVLNPEKKVDLLELAAEKRSKKEPLIVVFLGVNGTGKTTTIGKVAHLLLKNGFSVVLAAADTYRAGSIEQLEGHAKHLGIRLVRHEYGSDAAAVAFDAISHSRTHGVNSVLIDTAGRMQTNKNLMDEMQKIVRVTKPDLVLYVGDALTGNDAVTQAEQFCKLVRVDASILTKVDADAKGGAAVSVSYVTKRPTIYLGVGQTYDDLMPFEPEFLIKKILD
ncbi:signal recognition particle-docking protein FtsY [Candidatus Bathyarchaeota archaeon]|nr:signal recognition particle-docking protein FtsY [Candidatus Bathyarchaeota archaeon]